MATNRLFRRLTLGLPFLVLTFYLPGAFAKPATEPDDFAQGWMAYEAGRYQEAIALWRPLAEQGHAPAQLNLGTLYDYGQGVEESPEVAAAWYRRAAEQGRSAAQFNLGLMYATGRGIPQDLHQAAAWYLKAAEQGLAIAQYNLGILYSEGQGVERDEQRATLWLQRAADQDHADAQYRLARRHADGLQGTFDGQQPIDWLYRSATHYLEAGDIDKARAAIDLLAEQAPAHEYTRELQSKLGASGVQPQRTRLNTESSTVSFGTAWAVTATLVATNNHVIAGSDNITLVTTHGEEIVARVIVRDEGHDIALLEATDPARMPPALPLSSSRAKLGASVFTIGFPRVDVLGTTPKLSAGLISAVNGLADNPSTYQISVPIQSGNSGGPLVNMHGEVVGLVTSMLGVVDPATGATHTLPNVGYAVKIEILQQLLAALPQRSLALNRALPAEGDLEDLASRVQDSVLIVKAK